MATRGDPPAFGPRPGSELATVERSTLMHANRAVPAGHGSGRTDRRPTCAVVRYVEHDITASDCHRYAGLRRRSVPDHVGERLLNNPVRRQRDTVRDARQITLGVDLHGHPRCRHLRDQLVDVLETRCRVERRSGVVPVAQHRDESAQLGQCVAARPLDDLECTPRRGRVLVGREPATAGVHRDHAHTVGHDIVQFAGNANALGRNGESSQFGAGLFQFRCTQRVRSPHPATGA